MSCSQSMMDGVMYKQKKYHGPDIEFLNLPEMSSNSIEYKTRLKANRALSLLKDKWTQNPKKTK